MTKVVEFRGRTPDQLTDQLTSLKKEQFNLRFQRATGQLENTSRFRVIRHDIARIETVLNEKARGSAAAAPAKAAKKPAKRARAKAE